MNPTDPAHRSSSAPRAGLRSRIVPPSPPAPVPEPRPASRSASPEFPPQEDKSRLDRAPGATRTAEAIPVKELKAQPAATATDTAVDDKPSDTDVVRSTGSMAIPTLLSRITGFLRNVLIGTSLGSAVASAFNTANTLPNLITEIVLGAVLTSLVVPVLVRAEKEDEDRGAEFIRRLFTLSMTILVVVTLCVVIAAPILVRMYLRADGEVNVIQSTSFAIWLLPQVLFYGMFSLFMAVLNTKGYFRPGAWAPVANNIVSIAVLLVYQFLPGELDPSAPSGLFDPHVLLLGLGTTLGVVVQFLIMLPPLRRARVNLRPLWGIDARLKQFAGMGLAIIVYVGISQFGYAISTRVASGSDASAPFIYSQHWLLLQVPYGIIGVTLLTAIMPRLSRYAAEGDDQAVVRDLTLATKLTFIALIPVVIFFTFFGLDIAQTLFAFRDFTTHDADLLGWTLSFSAFTLIPYSLVLLHLRVFYAREEAWTPTFIIAGITVAKVVLSYLAPLVASSQERVVVLLGAANGFGFVAGALIGVFLLRRKLGHLQSRTILHTTAWAVGASLAGILASWIFNVIVSHLLGGVLDAMGKVGAFLHLGIMGILFLVVTGVALSFSGLPEVQNVGLAMGRIPGLRRFVRPNTDEQIAIAEPTQQELSAQMQGIDAFNASPVPPPMSAGVVRGPRLVPGAPVADGRFRLLADHGSVPGARFWQAKELATGRTVALVFVDTSGSAPLAPASPAAAAGAASEVVRRTRKLAALEHPGIAPNIEVRAYRSGCLVVADWVPGRPLRDVADSGGADPHAAAFATAEVADAAAAAHQVKTPLGLDNRSRIRISTEGVAVLAFPAVLGGATYEDDFSAIASTLSALVSDESEATDVLAVRDEARAATAQLKGEVDSSEGEQVSMAQLAEHLRQVGLTGQDAEDEPDVEATPGIVLEGEEKIPQPTAQPGFGSKSYRGHTLTLMGMLVLLLVIIVAAMSAWFASLLVGNRDESPISVDSFHSTQQEGAVSTQYPTSARLWWPRTHDGEQGSATPTAPDAPDAGSAPADAPEGAPIPAIIDGNSATEWESPDMRGEGEEQGFGILLTLPHTVNLSSIYLDAVGEQTRVTVYSVPRDVALDQLHDRSAARPLKRATLKDAPLSISVPQKTSSQAILLWFSPTTGTAAAQGEQVPPNHIHVKDVTITGATVPDLAATSTDNPL
ncbi:murein biosynthesis integral membrane protein MurJ [Corynebacterium uropygiale]|uniref:Murein biosynthesis integral membrane protein MurJ n=1 Tax=Corynebacterium uropygiale TaxID=1775911 RepID=A0A9X1QSL6_9CORY|nr:murein biosynthesis integral membrane protein MurJ [Corynebacterium uropygiale]